MAWSTWEGTVKGLKLQFSFLPKTKLMQLDNGSHFTAGIVQEWVQTGGVLWVFHSPYTTSTSQRDSRQDKWSPKMVFEISGSKVTWSTVGHCDHNQWPMKSKWCPWLQHYCSMTPAVPSGSKRTDDPWNPIHFPGQPVLLGLPAIGKVLLVLKTPWTCMPE